MGTSESKTDTAQTGVVTPSPPPVVQVEPPPSHSEPLATAEPSASKVNTVSLEVTSEPLSGTAVAQTDTVRASYSQQEEADDLGKAQSENAVSTEAAADMQVDERRALCMRACAVEMATGTLPTSPHRVMSIGPPVDPSLIASTPSNESKTQKVSPEDLLSTPGAVTGSDAGLIGKPVTLTELFSGQSPNTIGNFSGSSPGAYSYTNANYPYWSPQAELAGDYHVGEMWHNSAWYDYNASPTSDWSGIHQETSFGYPEYHQWMPPSSLRPVPSLTPGVTEPVVGLDRDSPRSVVLTLCGAWGALKTPTARLSKLELLSFRHAMPRGSRPKPLKSLRTVVMQSYAY